MTRRYGIDYVRLVTVADRRAPDEFAHCVRRLTALVEDEGAEIFASNQVIGEAFVAARHHYGVSRADARAGLRRLLRAGWSRRRKEWMFWICSTAPQARVCWIDSSSGDTPAPGWRF